MQAQKKFRNLTLLQLKTRMNKSISLLFAGLLLWFHLSAQTEVYTGKNGDQLFQLIYSPAQNTAAFSWSGQTGQGLVLLKKNKADDETVTFSDDNGQPVIKGRFAGDVLKAGNSIAGKSQELNIRRVEQHQLSKWAFKKAEGSFRHKNDRGTGAMIELNYFFPEKPEDPLVPVLATFYGLNARLGKPDLMMQSDVESFVERYRQMSTTAEGNTLEMNWMKSAAAVPVFVGGDLICLAKNSAVSTGTQAIRRHTEFGIFDLDAQRALTFDDIFAAESRAELSALLTSALLRLNGLEPGVELRKAGYFSESVHPNENIILGAGAIGFAYNVFELGPPSKGQPLLLLPFGQVAHLLRPGFRQRLEIVFSSF